MDVNFMDARDAVRDRHACQPATIFKRPIPDARDAVRDRHAHQPAAIIKRPIHDARDGTPFNLFWYREIALGINLSAGNDGKPLVGALVGLDFVGQRYVAYLDFFAHQCSPWSCANYIKIWCGMPHAARTRQKR